jgi:DNA modification methylase
LNSKNNKKTSKESDRITAYTDSEVIEELIPKIEIPKQSEFYKIPRRFGSIPVDELPLGCNPEKQYYEIYPRVGLPFQKANRITFGYPELDPNRLFWGDNLHVMRMLPSNSIDLIYIDPPFFSDETYNVIFGDQNEVRSFTDIWEGGMPSYQIWLNARVLEMKRLLKHSGTIFVHLDYHASHYVKIELDKIFGSDNFLNEIVWCYTGPAKNTRGFPRKHDTIFRYSKSNEFFYTDEKIKIPYSESFLSRRKYSEGKAGIFGPKYSENDEKKKNSKYEEGKSPEDWWNDIPSGGQISRNERIGYPTQKPEKLLERIIQSCSKEGDVVADFFCGGGTTPAVAQKLNRRWIACDQSRVAVAITQGRLESLFEDGKKQITLTSVPDISIEYWGTYEVPELENLSDDEFKNFIISAYGGRPSTSSDHIHGFKRETPIFVGSSKQDSQVTKNEVVNFAKDISEKKGKKQGIMLAWSFAQSARTAAEKLLQEGEASVDLIQISLTEIESSEFREHITKLHDEYNSFLKFILPPEVIVHHKKIKSMIHEFDATESISLNAGASIVNVQWDLDYRGRFTPTAGFAYGRDPKGKPLFKIQYEFERIGKTTIACRVQDDLGGEKIYTEVISVS